MAAAIEIRSVSKHFQLYHEHYSSLKERVIHFGRIPYEDVRGARGHRLRRRGGLDRRHPRPQRLAASRRCSSASPASCSRRRARSSPGAASPRCSSSAPASNHELTGRENVFMNASILGLSKTRHRPSLRRDRRVRRARASSSTCRCGTTRRACTCGSASRSRSTSSPTSCSSTRCSSVGDEAFQRKCIERVKQFQHEGRTILFVTHAADLVRRICDRAIVLDHGEMVIDAAPGEAVRAFRESLARRRAERARDAPAAAKTADGRGRRPRRWPRGATGRVTITDVDDRASRHARSAATGCCPTRR